MAVSPLPGTPNAVFTVRKRSADEHDAYIVVSFVDATLVLAVGDTVEEVSDSGFLGTVPTLSASLLGDDSLLQVHPGGLRHVRADGRVNEWRTPGRKTVTRATVNRRQAAIALSGGELVYFELDQTGQLMEIEKLETSGDVACLHIGPVPEGLLRSKFLAVGSFDSTVRILSLGAEDCLQTMGVQALAAAPSSLLLLTTQSGDVYLNAGLANGVLLRADVDRVTGQLSDTRARFLGARPSRLFPTTTRGAPAMLALSSRPWLGHVDLEGRFTFSLRCRTTRWNTPRPSPANSAPRNRRLLRKHPPSIGGGTPGRKLQPDDAKAPIHPARAERQPRSSSRRRRGGGSVVRAVRRAPRARGDPRGGGDG